MPNYKRVEVVWYEDSRGYAALIEIDGFLKVVPFFGPPDIHYFVSVQNKMAVFLLFLNKGDSDGSICCLRSRIVGVLLLYI